MYNIIILKASSLSKIEISIYLRQSTKELFNGDKYADKQIDYM